MRREAWAAAVVAAVLAVGCDDVFSAGGVATVTPMFATITARDLQGLDADESLSVELDGAYPTVFEFDGRDGPIDFQRVEITTPDAAPISMHIWLARQVPTHGIDLAARPGSRFRLANDRMAASLGIDESEPQSCDPIDYVELDDVVAVLFDADMSC